MTQSRIPSADTGSDSPVARSPVKSRRWVRPVLSASVSTLIVVAIFWFFIPQYTSVSDIWSSISAMTWPQVATLAVAALWNLATYWFVVVAATPGLTYPQAAVTTEASTAVSNTVPGGGAIGMALTYSMFGSWGFSKNRTSVSLVVAGIWNNFIKLAMPVLALSLVALQGSPSSGRVIAASLGFGALVVAVLLLALLLSSSAGAARIGRAAALLASGLRRVIGKPPVEGWDRATVKFRDRTSLLVRARWMQLTVATLVSHVSLFLVLLIALRALGVSSAEVSWAEALAVFAFARLLTAIPLTPGGVGIVEVALISGLVAAGGARPDVAAAVLLFRALTYVAPIPIGLGCYLFWRRNRSWRRSPGAAPRTSLVPEST